MVDPNEFRAALGRFASSVTVVTTRDGAGAPHGITVTAFSSVSLAPPLVVVCIAKSAVSHAAFAESKRFVVNVLSAAQQHLSKQFASKTPDRFVDVKHHAGLEGVPILEGALANIECRLHAAHEAGDHTLYIGEVEKVAVAEDAPLLYFRGKYAGIEQG